jgi:hypothetical protein
MRRSLTTAFLLAILAFGATQATAYNPCNPRLDTCK